MWFPAILIASFFASPTIRSVNAAPSAPAAPDSYIDFFLGIQLSKAASIVHSTSGVPRWSELDAPSPGTAVNVATEHDVVVTVQFCNENNIPFLAQSGGNGWATTFNLGHNGLLINMRGLNSITFNGAKTQAVVQGGILISEAIAAAYGNNTVLATGNCNCVSLLGANLGGGYGHMMGLYGFGVDNVLSLNVVTSNGNLVTVTPTQDDLFWALRGAGPNFGIVTSATIKAYPTPSAQLVAWTGILTFTDDKIEALVQAIEDLVLGPNMAIFLYYTTSGAPNFTPTVAASPFYFGSEADGKAAFASIYAVGVAFDGMSVVPYNQWNAGGDQFCVKGDYKPSYGAGFKNMVPSTWRAIWNEYKTFLQNPGTGSTTILLEAYSLAKARTLPDSSSSFAFRSTVNYNAVAIAWYADTTLTPTAEAFGSTVRNLWRATDSLSANSTYINFAFGDEQLPTVYGTNVGRLQSLKAKYDPFGKFDQWFRLR